MKQAIEWIVDNKEWIFSGIGIVVLSIVANALLRVFYKGKEPFPSQRINSGKNSNNYQAARDIQINNQPKHNDEGKK